MALTPLATPNYCGRFAPSPTGPLHAGSLVAALASWLDARAHGGRWLVRIEDVDTPRCVPGADAQILRQLAACALLSDGPVLYQSQRASVYQTALHSLIERGLVYPCTCSRSQMVAHWAALGRFAERGKELPYPGTCRPLELGRTAPNRIQQPQQPALQGLGPHRLSKHPHGPSPAWRLYTQDQLRDDCGDFVLLRADGCWSYQLAVVVDDALQGVNHIVRGADLAAQTPRQMLLQRYLGYAHPQYYHTPLVYAEDGEKLSKQNGAQALNVDSPRLALQALQNAAHVLGLPRFGAQAESENLAAALGFWVQAWADFLRSSKTLRHRGGHVADVK